jgi:predicted Zn-dependent protease
MHVRPEDRATVRPAAERERPAPTSPPRRRQPPRRPRPRGTDDPATAYDEALQLWRSDHSEAALRRLEAGTESRPLAAPLHYLSGLILLEGERTAEALAAFRRCTYADPEFALAHLAQAGLFARLGLQDRARVALDATARLVAGLEPDVLLLQGDGPTVGDVLELIAAHRQLLTPADAADGTGG